MGYIKHHTLCITSWSSESLNIVYEKSKEIAIKYMSSPYEGNFDKLITPIFDGITNGYATFYIIPDGSKEGWDLSERGDAFRMEVIKFIESLEDEDGGNSVKYVEVFYGDDEGQSQVVRHN